MSSPKNSFRFAENLNMSKDSKNNHNNLFPSTSSSNLNYNNQNNIDTKLFTNNNRYDTNDTKNLNLKQYISKENDNQKNYINNNNVVFRSMNNTPVLGAKLSTPPPLSKTYNDIPFKNASSKYGLNGSILNAVSTPSLLAVENNEQQQNHNSVSSPSVSNENTKCATNSFNVVSKKFVQEKQESDESLTGKKRTGILFIREE